MISVFIAGIFVGALLYWWISRWWRQSSIKKATDVVGKAAKIPTGAAKGLFAKVKSFYDNATKSKEKKP